MTSSQNQLLFSFRGYLRDLVSKFVFIFRRCSEFSISVIRNDDVFVESFPILTIDKQSVKIVALFVSTVPSR